VLQWRWRQRLLLRRWLLLLLLHLGHGWALAPRRQWRCLHREWLQWLHLPCNVVQRAPSLSVWSPTQHEVLAQRPDVRQLASRPALPFHNAHPHMYAHTHAPPHTRTHPHNARARVNLPQLSVHSPSHSLPTYTSTKTHQLHRQLSCGPPQHPHAEHQAARDLRCGTARIPSVSVGPNPVKGVKQRPSAKTTIRMHAHTHPHTPARTRTMHAHVSTCPNCQCTAPATAFPHIQAQRPTSCIAN